MKQAHVANRIHHLPGDRFIRTRLHYSPSVGYWGEVQDVLDSKWTTIMATAPYVTATRVRAQFEEIIDKLRRQE